MDVSFNLKETTEIKAVIVELLVLQTVFSIKVFLASLLWNFLTIRNFYKLKAYDTLESLSFRFIPGKRIMK